MSLSPHTGRSCSAAPALPYLPRIGSMTEREMGSLLGEAESASSWGGSLNQRFSEKKRKISDPLSGRFSRGLLPETLDVGRPRRKEGFCVKLIKMMCLVLLGGMTFALCKHRVGDVVSQRASNFEVLGRPGPAPRPPKPPTPQTPLHQTAHRHIGLLPKPPARATTAAWWDTESLSYCMYSEPRFNANCGRAITWRQRKDSLVRCLQEMRLWFEHFDLEYYMAFSSLLAIERKDEALAWANPCEVLVPVMVYEKIVAMITTGWRVDAAKEYRYVAEVVEDNPWDKRSKMFPTYKGEWWAPLDKVLNDAEHLGTNITDVGLLYKPQESCAALRVVDRRTGFYCEVLSVNPDAEEKNWQLQWPGGPRGCKPNNRRAKRCSADTCYVLPAAQLKPAKHCELAGVPLKCPADSASMLSAFYLQLKYAGSHNGQRDAAGAAEGSAHSYSLKMKDTAVRR
jgi:hypothetical protein